MDKIKELLRKCRDSSFNRNAYSVSKDLKNFVEGMTLHTWYEKGDHTKSYEEYNIDKREWLKRITPEFQRDNNKWTKKMKLKFIENILMGARTEFLYFRFNENEDAKILDGLQRTTALVDFFEGKIKPFGYSHNDLKEYMRAFSTNMVVKIYTFETMDEAINFYVDMNENITHSKKDIEKAKAYLTISEEE